MKAHALLLSPAQARALDKRLRGLILQREELRLLRLVRSQLDGIVESICGGETGAITL